MTALVLSIIAVVLFYVLGKPILFWVQENKEDDSDLKN